jgi:AraC-like DNA-binding protein
VRTNWAFASESGDETRAFDAVGRTQFDDGPFRGFMEYQAIAPGIALYRVEGQATRDYCLQAGGESPDGMLVLGCMLGGSGRIAAEGDDDLAWNQTAQLYTLTPFGRRVSYHVSARSPWRSVAIKLGASALDRFTDGQHLPTLVRNAVKPGASPISAMQPLGAALTRVADDLSRPLYAGRMATLYREAKVLELLALQLDALNGDASPPATLATRDLARVRDARDRLLADLRETPNLHDLAHAVGLSAKRLNQGFRELYGTTAFELLRDARLDAARSMLDEGLDVPLKQIAWQVGYSQATNFISAYRRRFGVSPGLHKRLRSDEN